MARVEVAKNGASRLGFGDPCVSSVALLVQCPVLAPLMAVVSKLSVDLDARFTLEVVCEQ